MADSIGPPRATSSGAYAAIGLVGVQLLSFGSMWLVSRALGPDAYGRLGLALIAGVYAYQVVQAGLDAFQTRLLAQAVPDESRRILGGTLRQKQWAALFALAAGAVLAMLWKIPDERALIFIGVLDGVALAFTLPSAFDARGATATYFGFAVARQAIYLAGVAVLILLAPQLLSVQNVLILHLAAILPQLWLERRWIRTHYGAPDFSESGKRSAEQFRAAIPLSVGSAAWQLAMVIGPPILEFTGHRTDMGFLVLSNQLAMAAHSLSLLFSRIAMAKLAQIADPFSAAFRTAWMLETLRFSALAVALAACGAFIGPYFIERIWGTAFAAAGALFAIDVWRIVGAFGGGVTSAALVSQSRLSTLAFCHVVSLASGVALALIFVPVHGARAAVWAVVAARGGFLLLSTLSLLVRPTQKGVPA